MDSTWRLPAVSTRLAPILPAQLVSNELTADLNLHRPQDGLRRWLVSGTAFPAKSLLGVLFEQGQQGVVLTDCYTRGDDLIATYHHEPDDAVSSQIYWRWLRSSLAPGSLGGVEIIVSVQTELLHSEPHLTLASHVAAEEIWMLMNNEENGFQQVFPTPQSETLFDQNHGLGAFLIRGPARGLSYLQIIHPSDLHKSRLRQQGEAPASDVQILHELFPDPLEKGVIRRGRARGWFLERAADFASAIACYRQWLAEPPPLTT